MAKSKEELDALKQEVIEFAKKLKTLDEDEIREVVGGKTETTILPSDNEFWESFNPNFIFSDEGLEKKK